MKPKITIIVATFNSEKTLKESLDSILNQTYNDWECLIIDGLSKDHTCNIAEEYKQRDSRFRYISEKDKGIYDAMNKGVLLAKGEWIYILGSDDNILPDGLKSFVKHMENADLIYGNFIGLYPSGNTYNGVSLPLSKMPKVMPASHQAMIMKKNLIEECGGFDLSFRSRADNNLVVKAFVNGYKFKRIDDYIAQVRLDGFSSTRWDTIDQIYRILKNNKATSYPYFWALYYGIRWYIAKKILDRFRNK